MIKVQPTTYKYKCYWQVTIKGHVWIQIIQISVFYGIGNMRKEGILSIKRLEVMQKSAWYGGLWQRNTSVTELCSSSSIIDENQSLATYTSSHTLFLSFSRSLAYSHSIAPMHSFSPHTHTHTYTRGPRIKIVPLPHKHIYYTFLHEGFLHFCSVSWCLCTS